MDPVQAVLSCLDTTDSNGYDPVGAFKGHEDLCGVEVAQVQGAEPTYTLTKLDTSGLRGWIEGSTGRPGPVAEMRLIVAGAHNLDETRDITERVRFERAEMR